MKFRRHHNNKGYRQIKNGRTIKQAERIAKKLGINKDIESEPCLVGFLGTGTLVAKVKMMTRKEIQKLYPTELDKIDFIIVKDKNDKKIK